MDILEDYHTHPGNGQPPIKAKDLVGIEKPVYTSASDELQASADTERSGTQIIYTKKKEIQIFRTGTIRVKWEDKHVSVSFTGKTQIYINGVASSGEYTTSTSYTARAYNVTVKAGDLVQLYAKVTGDYSTYYVKNFRIYYDINVSEVDYEVLLD